MLASLSSHLKPVNKVRMVLWIIVLIVLCSIWFFIDDPKEGFLTEPTAWDALRNFFHYQVSPVENPAGIPIASPGLDALGLDSAVETPGFSTRLFPSLMDTRDPNATEDEKCRAIGHPRLLAASRATRTNDQVGKEMGCGWWFFSDKPSVSAYGYGPNSTELKNQPMYPANLPSGGTWIWDVDRAVQEEEIKRCKAIETCSLISGADGCGYCTNRQHAVPVKADGTVKYPSKPVDNIMDGSCTTTPVSAKNCADIVITPRDFTGDFDYDINGNPIRNDLYNRVRNPQGLVIQDPCVLENGRITKECRLRMCLELAQCTYAKGLHRMINDGVLNDTDKLALYYVKRKGGLDIPASVWEPIYSAPSGNSSEVAAPAPTPSALSKGDAEYIMQRLYALATSGPPSTQRSAALWLLNETPFNDCDFEDAYAGPYPLLCVQREFRKAGCQASGTAYPSNTDISGYNTMRFSDIKMQFRQMYEGMNKDVKNVREQDETIQKCLGIDVRRAADEIYLENPNMCREIGVEFWYTTIPTQGRRILYARSVEKALDISGTLLNLRGGVRGFTARTYVELSGTPVSVTLDAGAGYSFWVNREQVLAITGNPNKYQVNLVPYTRSEIEVRFEGSGILNPGKPVLTLNPNMPFYLAQSAWKPFVSVIARKDGFGDDNHFLQLEGVRPTRKYEGRYGIPIDGVSVKSVATRGIWMPAMRTVGCMVYWSGFTGQANVWRMDQGTGSTAETIASLQIIDNKPVFTIVSGTSSFRLQSIALSNPNKWLHIAVVFGPTLGSTKLYINGVDSSTQPVATGILDLGATAFTRTVLGGPGFAGGYGWFHIYDRDFTPSQLQREVRYDDPSLSDVADSILVSNRNV